MTEVTSYTARIPLEAWVSAPFENRVRKRTALKTACYLGDSYYEYLIKTHQLLGGGAPQYGRMYSEAMSSANEVLAQEVNTVPGQVLLTLGEYSWGKQIPTCDHLVCTVFVLPCLHFAFCFSDVSHFRQHCADLLRRRNDRSRIQASRAHFRYEIGRGCKFLPVLIDTVSVGSQ